jgi:hypothetical protein
MTSIMQYFTLPIRPPPSMTRFMYLKSLVLTLIAVWFLLFAPCSYAVRAGHAIGHWEGQWTGHGRATIFGSGPHDCSNVNFTITKVDQGDGSFLLKRSGTKQQCGPYQVVQKDTQVVVKDAKVFASINGALQDIGNYSDTKITTALTCHWCHDSLSLIEESATLTNENSYELNSTVKAKDGSLSLDYFYQLERVSD